MTLDDLLQLCQPVQQIPGTGLSFPQEDQGIKLAGIEFGSIHVIAIPGSLDPPNGFSAGAFHQLGQQRHQVTDSLLGIPVQLRVIHHFFQNCPAADQALFAGILRCLLGERTSEFIVYSQESFPVRRIIGQVNDVGNI
ncbi:hypothetical protein DSECCO2_471470 [anaerobic digester metagenome]